VETGRSGIKEMEERFVIMGSTVRDLTASTMATATSMAAHDFMVEEVMEIRTKVESVSREFVSLKELPQKLSMKVEDTSVQFFGSTFDQKEINGNLREEISLAEERSSGKVVMYTQILESRMDALLMLQQEQNQSLACIASASSPAAPQAEVAREERRAENEVIPMATLSPHARSVGQREILLEGPMTADELSAITTFSHRRPDELLERAIRHASVHIGPESFLRKLIPHLLDDLLLTPEAFMDREFSTLLSIVTYYNSQHPTRQEYYGIPQIQPTVTLEEGIPLVREQMSWFCLPPEIEEAFLNYLGEDSNFRHMIHSVATLSKGSHTRMG
jgi:hypothetical protein